VEVVRTESGAEATVPAVVRARRRAALASRIPASVVELPLREGERAEAGAVLVRLDDAALRSAVAAAEAADQAAAADLARMEALLGKGAATPREREEATARAAAARAALLGARDNLAYAVLRAPFGGTVASRPVNVGDVVSPGTTLIEVEGEGGLEIQAAVEADLAAMARPGLRAKALVDGQAAPLLATVRSVSPAGDPGTHRFEVRADLPPAPGLRSGLFARLVLPSPTTSPRLLVPAAAVFERGGLRGVFVIKEGRARLRWVAAGATAAGQTEIRAGVDAGERVATDPAGLEDGAPVREQAVRGGEFTSPERTGGPGGATQHPPAR
jgi:RND family efflux transporter MFP subunit